MYAQLSSVGVVIFTQLIILHTFLLSADLFQIQILKKILSKILSKCQTLWIKIRPDKMSGLIWIQTACNGYQQTTKEDKELMCAKSKCSGKAYILRRKSLVSTDTVCNNFARQS